MGICIEGVLKVCLEANALTGCKGVSIVDHPADGVVEVSGLRYSYQVFENHSLLTPDNRAQRVIKNDDGCVTIQEKVVPDGFWSEDGSWPFPDMKFCELKRDTVYWVRLSAAIDKAEQIQLARFCGQFVKSHNMRFIFTDDTVSMEELCDSKNPLISWVGVDLASSVADSDGQNAGLLTCADIPRR